MPEVIGYRTSRTSPAWATGPAASGSPFAALQPNQGTGGQQTGINPGMPLDSYLFPPAGSTQLLGTDFQPSLGAGQIVQLPACTIVCPAANAGVVHSIKILLDQITATTNVFWTVKRNGIPVHGYNNLRLIPRSGAASVEYEFVPVRIELSPNDVVTMQATNVDGAPYNVGGQLIGWYEPAQVGG